LWRPGRRESHNHEAGVIHRERFKATQEKFEREREEYFVATLGNARNGSYAKPRWS
jgi:hypothetical protein